MWTGWTKPPFDPAVGRALDGRSGPAATARAVAEDASALVRAEIDLAKAELTRSMREKAIGSGFVAAAAILAWLGAQALLIAAGFALALVMPAWTAALVVGGALLVIGGLLVLIGRRKMRTPVALDRTKANLEEDLTWTKQHLARR